jgi:fumarate hydratase subunit alpha
MKIISADRISRIVADLCVRANLYLRPDVLARLRRARKAETSKRAKRLLDAIIDNALIARAERLAICQDTGLPVVFVELGQNVRVSGDLKKALNQGVDAGYKKACLRQSVIRDPLVRGRSTHSPALIHVDIVPGNSLKITVLPKGFGCENKSQLKMFHPTAGIEELKDFIINTVKSVGPDACPPYVVGIGIGGTADYASLLAKKALLRKIKGKTADRLERELLAAINKLNIGPMGLGGRTTALAVNIEKSHTHIAGLPVALNFSCHALRSATEAI